MGGEVPSLAVPACGDRGVDRHTRCYARLGQHGHAPRAVEPARRAGYDDGVVTDGIRAFMARDWQRARDAKDAYWAERVARLGPIEAMRIADELRRQVRLQHPDWPDAASRKDDLRQHVRMNELFDRVDAARRA